MAGVSGVVVVLTTVGRGRGEELASRLVEDGVAACVSIAPVRSVYFWKGRVERDDEDLLIIKTSVEMLPELVSRLRSIHPYEVPELLVIPVMGFGPDYGRWVEEVTARNKTPSGRG
ncbi:MAG: divalent-cation tolerance protein CutA [Crenarchaeota archaeon]|nr:divalent-cation tolerance protein CutA [Thermoproteota archaeon]